MITPLKEICEIAQIEPKKARKILRKLKVVKHGRFYWVWYNKKEINEIVNILRGATR